MVVLGALHHPLPTVRPVLLASDSYVLNILHSLLVPGLCAEAGGWLTIQASISAISVFTRDAWRG
jgi:hypothetical protein